MSNDDDSAATAGTSKTPEKSMSALGLKLPPFWPKDPTLWFAQVEAQFETRGITSQGTMYAHVIASLSPEFAQEIRDLLLNPPKKHQYTVIKDELIKRTSESEQKRLQKLLISEELGDKKPSQLLRRMKQLLGNSSIEDNILRQLFLQRMPQNVQLILASTADSIALDELAVIADRIVEVSGSKPTVAATSQVASASTSNATGGLEDRISSLEAQLSELINQLKESNLGNRPSRSRSPSPSRPKGRKYGRPRPRSRSPRYQEHVGPSCWYHWRYGTRAHRCIKPCSFIDSTTSTETSTSTNTTSSEQAN